MTSADSWQVLIALIWPIAQEWLKNSPLFSWVSKQTPKANAALSVAVATLTTVGFHLAWTGSAAVGWSITLTIPAVAALKHAAGAWVLQHIVYKKIVKDPATQVQIATHLSVLRMMLQPMPPQVVNVAASDSAAIKKAVEAALAAQTFPPKKSGAPEPAVDPNVVSVVRIPPPAEPFFGPPR